MRRLLVKPKSYNLTTKEFYKDILSQVRPALIYAEVETIEFDLNGLKNINPLVLPLFFSLGEELKKRGIKSILDIIPRLTGDDYSNISYFLEYSGFLKAVSDNDVFKLNAFRNEIKRFNHIKVLYFDYENYIDNENIIIDRTNKSGRFLINTSKVYRDVNKFYSTFREGAFRKLFPAWLHGYYEYENSLETKLRSLMLDPIYEIVLNSISHAISGSVVSVNYIEASENLLISLSDCGSGLSSSLIPKREIIKNDPEINDRVKENIEELFKQADNDPKHLEMYMILISLIYRMYHNYGLNKTVEFFLGNNGYFRIHSNNIRIVFSNRMLKYFNVDKIMELPNFLKENEEYNMMKDIIFPGVHIELELNLSKIPKEFWNESVKSNYEKAMSNGKEEDEHDTLLF